MQAQAIELIDKTIAVLERDGWRTGAYNYHSDKPHCLVGAMHVAAYGYQDAYEIMIGVATETDALFHYTYKRVAEHLGEHSPRLVQTAQRLDVSPSPENWNDAVATSKEEVIEMLNHCKFHMLRNAEMVARPWPEVRQPATA